jgi:NADPH2:quinone reductase
MNASVRALVCHNLTDDLSGVSVSEIASPSPRAGHVSVRVHAAALNFPDLLMTRGGYQYRPEVPFVIGMEGAGEVVDAAGGIGDIAIGDRVCFRSRAGACAGVVVLPAADVHPVPVNFTVAEAAAYQIAALTAYIALVHRGALAAGETLLVHGASGGVGLAAVQLGHALGARVIATGTSAAKLAIASNYGADHTIASSPTFRDRVMQLTEGRGADVIFDPVGGDVFDESVHCIAWGGRLLVVGFASGRIPDLRANLPLLKGFSLIGVRAGETGRRDPVRGAQAQKEIERLAGAGIFKPHIGARCPLEDGVEALRAMALRKTAGKIVIDMP